jgi:hypothetical protein
MATKVYGVWGRTNVELSIPVGKATLPLRFERGNLDKKYFRPATFMTSKKYVQDMIENSQLFGSTIQLVKVIESKGDTPAAEAPEAPAVRKAVVKKPAGKQQVQKAAGSLDFPEIDSREGAIEILKQNGAKATDLVTNEKIAAFMSRNNITFSNFSF